MPRLDGDPVFAGLLEGGGSPEDERSRFDIEIEGFDRSRQSYVENTPVLVTALRDREGRALEVTDFAPRFSQFGRRFRPMALVRVLRPVEGQPRIRIRIRPRFGDARRAAEVTHGSNHIRYVGSDLAVRLTTDAPACLHPRRIVVLPRGAGHPVPRSGREPDPSRRGDRAGLPEARPPTYWREWVRHLHVPLEWQEAVIRAAITLKLCWFEETGAIIAAMTTSVPEAPPLGPQLGLPLLLGTRRLLRDPGVERARRGRHPGELPSLRPQPRRRRGRRPHPTGVGDRSAPIPARADRRPRSPDTGAWDRCASATTLGATSSTTCTGRWCSRTPRRSSTGGSSGRWTRATSPGSSRSASGPFASTASRTRGCGSSARSARVHTYSSLMCWAACDRLANIAAHLGRAERAAHSGAQRAGEIRAFIEEEAWNPRMDCYTGALGVEDVDASLLLLSDLGFHEAGHPRFRGTVEGHRVEPAARPAHVPLRDGGRLRPAADCLQHLHLLVHRRPRGDGRVGDARASTSRRCWRGATTSDSSPRTSTRPPANSGGTTRRPTRSSGSSTARCA